MPSNIQQQYSNQASNIGMAAPGLAALTGVDPQEANQLLALSKYPVDELRQRGVPGHIVDKVELHRALLQRTLQGQTSFRDGLKNNQVPGNSSLIEALHQQQQHQQQQQQQQQRLMSAASMNHGPQPGYSMSNPGMSGPMNMRPPGGENPARANPTMSLQQHTPSAPVGRQAEGSPSYRPSPQDQQKALQLVLGIREEYKSYGT